MKCEAPSVKPVYDEAQKTAEVYKRGLRVESRPARNSAAQVKSSRTDPAESLEAHRREDAFGTKNNVIRIRFKIYKLLLYTSLLLLSI